MLKSENTLFEIYMRNKGKNFDEPSLYRRRTSQTHGNLSSNFNLFEILRGYDDINKVAARFMCELLSPDGTHGMGTFFLKSFVYDVLNLDIPEFELKRASAYTVESRHNGTCFFKVRININRCSVILLLDIYDKLENESGIFLSRLVEPWNTDFVYLLTLNGLNGDVLKWLHDTFGCKFLSLSLKYDVMNWIHYCMKQLDVIDGVIYQALSQFSDMICNFLSEYAINSNSFSDTATSDFILDSPENTEAALNIHDEVHNIADCLKNRVLAALRLELLKITLWSFRNFEDYVKIGDDGYLYVRSDISYIRRTTWRECYLCNGASPNFKFPNEALFELCDKLIFNVFVSRCVEKILEGF